MIRLFSLLTERILQLAREEDDEPCILSTSQPTAETTVLQAAIKRGPEFFQAISVTLRPISPFIRVRPKLPRAMRQKVLDRLTGQHLALEAVLSNGLGGTATEAPEAHNEALSPSSLATDSCLVQRCIAAAVEQEADMYDRCSSSQVYQNLASRCTALDWRKEVRAAAEAEKAYENLLAVQRTEDENKKEEEGKRQRKRSKIEHHREVVNTNTVNNGSATLIGAKKNKTDSASFAATATKTLNPLNYESIKQQGPLVESDLDWYYAKPDTSDEIQRQKLRQRVMQALESCPNWKVLTVDERVVSVERCVLKVVSSTGGDISDSKSIQDTALQRLALQYIDFMLKKRKH